MVPFYIFLKGFSIQYVFFCDLFALSGSQVNFSDNCCFKGSGRQMLVLEKVMLDKLRANQRRLLELILFLLLKFIEQDP